METTYQRGSINQSTRETNKKAISLEICLPLSGEAFQSNKIKMALCHWIFWHEYCQRIMKIYLLFATPENNKLVIPSNILHLG